MGIRMALGARSRDVVWLLVRQGTGLTLAGGVRLLGAVALTWFLGSLLYGVGRMDGVTLVASSSVLLVAAPVVSWITAWQATRVDPMEALRH
jgi:putative ABC transport system permease protein